MTTSKPPFPRALRIEPASQCNLACTHCPTGTIEMSRGIMPEPIFLRVLQELKNNIDSVKVVVLYHGGEPLLNNQFYEMVRRVKLINAALFVKSVTNGMALNEENAKKLIGSGINAIEISLDGLSAEESQSIRKNSNTEKIVANVHRLIAIRNALGVTSPTVSLATTQFLRSKQTTLPIQAAEPPAWLHEEFGDSVEYKANFGMQWPHMNVGHNFDLLPTSSVFDDENYCDHVINTITVRSDGNVVPCCYDLTSKLVMGNILETSLNAIWEGARYQRLRESIVNRDFYSICRSCAVVKPPVYLIPRTNIGIDVIVNN